MAEKKHIAKNLATWDRALRVAIAAALLGAWAFYGFHGFLLPILGAALLVNAAMGTCGLYAALGISTCPVKFPPPSDPPAAA